MKTNTAGSKFQKGRKGTEIAALIRSEIRAAAKADGPLHGCKVSVRFSWATHSMSISIRVESAPVNVRNAVWVKANAANPYHFQDGVSRESAAGTAIIAECDHIAAQYNRFDSDSQSDYFNDGFFCRAAFTTEIENEHDAAILCEHPACCGCADCEMKYAA